MHRNLALLCKSFKKGLNLAKLHILPDFLHQPANIFTRIYPSYSWHFATLTSRSQYNMKTTLRYLDTVPKSTPKKVLKRNKQNLKVQAMKKETTLMNFPCVRLSLTMMCFWMVPVAKPTLLRSISEMVFFSEKWCCLPYFWTCFGQQLVANRGQFVQENGRLKFTCWPVGQWPWNVDALVILHSMEVVGPLLFNSWITQCFDTGQQGTIWQLERMVD